MSTNETVTVVVTRKVKRGREPEYEDWLRRLLEESKSMKGYLGATIQKPAAGSSEYTSIFRFNSVENLRKFEESDLRAKYLREVVDYVEADAIWKKFTGLEFWFSPPKGTVIPQPSRFRMALVMIAVVFGLVVSIGQLVVMVASEVPQYIRLFVTIFIEIFLMTYVIMPRITRMLAKWIYPSSKTAVTANY
ncbi:MAG: antibiotic biosynthesis monooxygenase [Thermoproteota archaeon]|nr:antibiotic biosynthesis monooxygenase [Thermoproteota archaeon]